MFFRHYFVNLMQNTFLQWLYKFFLNSFFVQGLTRFLDLCKKYTSTHSYHISLTSAINVTILTCNGCRVTSRGRSKRCRVTYRTRGTWRRGPVEEEVESWLLPLSNLLLTFLYTFLVIFTPLLSLRTISNLCWCFVYLYLN